MGFFQKLFKRKPKDKKYRLGLHKSSQSLGNLKLILEIGRASCRERV